MPNQAYYDKIQSYKNTCEQVQRCLNNTNIEFIDEDDNYGLYIRINGIEFSLQSNECHQERVTLLGKQIRTYDGWEATVYDNEGNDIFLEEISEINGLHNAILECYLWTIKHIFNNKIQIYEEYSAWDQDKND